MKNADAYEAIWIYCGCVRREREKFGIVHTHAPFGWKIGGSNRMVGGSKGYVGAFVSDCDVHTK